MLDIEEFNVTCINNHVLGISKTKCLAYMEMLIDEGYIKGYEITYLVCGETITKDVPRITLKGAEYLQGNGIIQHMYRAAKAGAARSTTKELEMVDRVQNLWDNLKSR